MLRINCCKVIFNFIRFAHFVSVYLQHKFSLNHFWFWMYIIILILLLLLHFSRANIHTLPDQGKAWIEVDRFFPSPTWQARPHCNKKTLFSQERAVERYPFTFNFINAGPQCWCYSCNIATYRFQVSGEPIHFLGVTPSAIRLRLTRSDDIFSYVKLKVGCRAAMAGFWSCSY